MISRRSVRVKVMQTVYAYERSEDALPATFRKNLHAQIYSVNKLYLYLLLIIREVAYEVQKVHDIKTSKHLPTAEDLNYSTKILSNNFIQYLNHDETFLRELKKAAVNDFLDEELVSRLYTNMYDSEEYKKYAYSHKNFDPKEDRSIIKYIFNEIMLSDEIFHEHIEEVFPSWEDDAEFVVGAVRDIITKSKDSYQLHVNRGSVRAKLIELSEFGDKLFEKVIRTKEEQSFEIEEYLKNWEIERIAVLDLIMIRMGLTEFTDFPSIPVKVTMNEYIEIAKSYSSPRSKDFVNGVLDRMHKDMSKKGLIEKTGRGLRDN